MARLFLTGGFIQGENVTQDLFSDDRDPTKVRVYSAAPVFPQAGLDQQAEITEVYNILKNTSTDNKLQVHCVVQNKGGGLFGIHTPFLFFSVYELEI